MRPIKFRAFNKQSKSFEYFEWGNEFPHDMDMILFEDPHQFTGLKDKNGKEIWEGDIVASNGGVWIDAVEWKENWDDCECSYAGWSFSVSNPKYVEVIGNVHENPELLR